MKKSRTSRGLWNYFHDCHICQGMKQGRGNTVEDLSRLFTEAEIKEVGALKNEAK